MKTKMLVLLLFLLGACTPSQSSAAGISTAAKTISFSTATPVVIQQRTNSPALPVQQPVATVTVTPQPDSTEKIPSPVPVVQPTLYSFVAEPTLASLVYQEYDPKEWEVIPGSYHISDTLVVLDPNQRLWQTDGHNLIYFDGENWGKITRAELNYDRLYLWTMSPDGTLWLEGRRTGRRDLIRYKDDRVVAWQIPDVTDKDTDHIVLTDDHKQGVWVAVYEEGHAPKHLFHFDGLDWQEYPLPFRHNWVCCSVGLVTDSNGYLWLNTYGDIGFARFNGKNWHEYKASDFWIQRSNPATDRVLLAAGSDGSMWAVFTYHPTIYRFYPDGKIDKISQSFMGEDFGFAIDMFVDRKNYLWMSSFYASGTIAPLVYWDGNHWNTFSHLPFRQVKTLLDQDGKLFIQTETGWYWYTPKR